jgi:hypothetical protein
MHDARSKIPRAQGVIIPDDIRQAVGALVSSMGERKTLERLDTNRMTLARIMGGLPVQKGTLAHIREQLQTNASQGTAHV